MYCVCVSYFESVWIHNIFRLCCVRRMHHNRPLCIDTCCLLNDPICYSTMASLIYAGTNSSIMIVRCNNICRGFAQHPRFYRVVHILPYIPPYIFDRDNGMNPYNLVISDTYKLHINSNKLCHRRRPRDALCQTKSCQLLHSCSRNKLCSVVRGLQLTDV